MNMEAVPSSGDVPTSAVNSYPAIRSVGQNPKNKKIKKPVDLTSAYLTSVLTMTMAPTGAGRGISSARRPGMWKVNDRWPYGFPTCMGGILLG